MDQLAQYYNEQFKQQLDPPFETLTPEEVIRLEKILIRTTSYAGWKLRIACEQIATAFKESSRLLKLFK